MNSKTTVFLDTSIQTERILGRKGRKVEIEQHLPDDSIQFISSDYVFMEFQRSVISDHAYIHRKMLEHDDWQEIVAELHSGTKRYRPRALARSMQIFTQMMVVGQMNRELALEFLKIQIERGLSAHFWHHVTPISDAIACDLVQKGTSRQSTGAYQVADSCRKESAACHLPDFFTIHHSKLVIIRDYLTTYSDAIKGQDRVERLLNNVIEDPKTSLGQTSCWPLGDIIIALQMPAGCQLWTIDRDFGSIAEALEIELHKP